MKYTNLICPVCNDFEFTKPLEGEEKEIRQCHICGWIYNEDEIEHSEKLEKYKKIFHQHRKENPEWNWLKANAPAPVPHICPVCAKYKFEDENSFDICPYCGWEDDGTQIDDPNYDGGANSLSLNKYKELYSDLVKKDPKYVWGKTKDK